MRIQRFFFTALLAALLWPLLIWFDSDPLLGVMLKDYFIAAYLLGSIFFGTLAAIWCIEAWVTWSAGNTLLIGLKATVVRLAIAIIAANLFAITCSRLLQAIGVQTTYLEVLFDRGVLVLIAVWAATQVVDLLKRNYKPGSRA